MRKGQKSSPETVARQRLTKANWTEEQRKHFADCQRKSYTKEKRKIAAAKQSLTKANWDPKKRQVWRDKLRAANLGITVVDLKTYDLKRKSECSTEFVCPRCGRTFKATGGQWRRMREGKTPNYVPCCSPSCTNSYFQTNVSPEQRAARSAMRSANTKAIHQGRTKEERIAIIRKGVLSRDRARIRNTWDSKTPQELTRIFKQRVSTGVRNGNFTGSSAIEEKAYKLLVSVFGKVERQYADERYPYPCDFYLPKYDTFIELHGFWVHGSEPFDAARYEHRQRVKSWKAKKHTMYDAAIKAWTVRDPLKVEAAKKHRLNFYRFYGIDALITWLGVLRKRVVLKPTAVKDSWFNTLSKINTGRIVKHFQFYEFHKQELKAWKKLSTRVKLYANRQTWANKQPESITDQSILTGLNLAGLAKGYSSFEPSWLREFVSYTRCTKIYDPCGGWGHRMIAAAFLGVAYIYNDANAKTVSGILELRKWLRLRAETELWVGNNDAALVSQEALYKLKPDAVFTCPPYHNAEWYSEEGAENLDRADFDRWWKSVVKTFPSTVKHVGLVVPSAMLETFSQGLSIKKVVPLQRTSVFRTNRSRSREVLVLGALC